MKNKIHRNNMVWIDLEMTGLDPEKDKIIEIAREHDIPVKDDADLVEVLAKLDIEQEIPADVYVVVAELLAFVYSLNSRKKESP